jgi:hypothetical protein
MACAPYRTCEDTDPSLTLELPERLSETGLYAQTSTRALAPDVWMYAPQFPLWSDGSDKQRWIFLPPGKQIDTSNPDEWRFPSGTKIWKQFSKDGHPIETRLLQKRGDSENDWLALAYVWDDDGHDATAAPLGVIDAHGTEHDVPAAGECFACHGGRASFVLGFSAIQLAGASSTSEMSLADLIEADVLSDPPEELPVIPGNFVEVEALGYLHANCSHCHNKTRPERGGARCFDPRGDYDFTLALSELESVAATPTYRTVVGEAVRPGNPSESPLFKRVNTTNGFQRMPPLATERVDESAVETLRLWIEGL